MIPFFEQLGRTVLERWKQANFSLEAFPEIAQTAIDAAPPSEHVDLDELVYEFLCNDEQPFQSQSGFGQPELIAYVDQRFYIQILFWLDGTTDIHQHEFSGAFHVMAGSSIHAEFEFEVAHSVTPYLRVGDLRMKQIELLETGHTVPITSGQGCIHSLFHLETPSVTVVVRTQNDPGTGPQFNYLPPHVAMDPNQEDALTMRRKQLVDVLESVGHPGYTQLVIEMIGSLDFERGFHTLQHAMGHLQDLGDWEPVLESFQEKHGELANGVPATLTESRRRDIIADMRAHIDDPDLRFFLALLMNVPNRDGILGLITERFPDQPPIETVVSWAGELLMPTDFGIALLDATVPESADQSLEDQADLLLAALQYGIEESSDGNAFPEELLPFYSALSDSCLSVLFS